MALLAEGWFGIGRKVAAFENLIPPFFLMVVKGLLTLHRQGRQACWSILSLDAFQEVFLWRNAMLYFCGREIGS